MADESSKLLKDSLKNLLTSGEYSDFTINCKDKTWRVHKAIVCPRSGYFARAVNFGREAKDRMIDLLEDETEIVGLMLEYLYIGDYTVPTTDKTDLVFPHTCNDSNLHAFVCSHHACATQLRVRDWSCGGRGCIPSPDIFPANLVHHARLYELADKYQVMGLKSLVREKFILACQSFWNTSKFPIAAEIVFATTPEEDKGLREVVVSTISDHMILLKQPEMESLMVTYNGLAYGLLKIMLEAGGWQ
ncbi:uncharacterized protein BDR25DRAFT_28881 [Lindgomyces ingoldianus]|uniref:Uncharacterized protein n=1 Tax=Lindgomyces ingoldianus TaxID=673940 RepID=A0ACB6QVE9_9PLEO|nr:uncharacterized protein BDR25DRAFT_28881 [Lindgomyces ingoldianus]KAF2470994.1 hypothetical protein BDR25DRAFT_28881 [Lindgomyces ingoldianus]